MQSTKHNQNRGGFTLVELLMVVAIISILVTLSVVVMAGIAEQAEEEATKTTVLKVSRLLEERIEAFDRGFRGTRQDDYVKATVGLLEKVDGQFRVFRIHPDQAPPALRYLAYKAAFRFEIPQRMVELNIGGGDSNGNGIPDIIENKVARPVALQQLIDEGTAAPTDAQVTARVTRNWQIHTDYETAAHASDLDELHSTESAELLYFMLVQAGNFGSSTTATDSFSGPEIQDTDGDGFNEFVDAWGNPLQFYRWPTRLIDPTAPNPFAPDFDVLNDPTEVDPVPDNSTDGNFIENDGQGREILAWEREYAGLLIRGLPPSPFQIGSVTQRDQMFVDPDDPVGILYSFIEDPYYKNLDVDLTREINEAQYHTLDTYHVPLIVSAGPDERLGLREPNRYDAPAGIYGNLAQYASTFTPEQVSTSASPPRLCRPDPGGPVFEALLDNLTNRNRRAGARR